jgi:hypothetical protein
VHYIPVREDLSDLLGQIEWALGNYDETVRIGRQGQARVREVFEAGFMAQHFARALESCHGPGPEPPVGFVKLKVARL